MSTSSRMSLERVQIPSRIYGNEPSLSLLLLRQAGLDTFKDIWEPPYFAVTSKNLTEFRYLQGYMGTQLLVDPVLEFERLDTFKDIWEHLCFALCNLQKNQVQIPSRIYGNSIFNVPSASGATSLDTFKDIWEPQLRKRKADHDRVQIPSRIYGNPPKIGLITHNYSRLQSIFSEDTTFFYRRLFLV